MLFSDLLNFQRIHQPVISFVGGGGKTTAMLTLAAELRATGKAVLVTTTTAIYVPQSELVDQRWVHPTLPPCDFPRRTAFGEKVPQMLVWGSAIQKVPKHKDKLKGIPREAVDQWHHQYQEIPLLVEADGSKRKPVKAPDDYEPVIPESTGLVVGVIGLRALGAPMDVKNVHRLGLFCRVTESQPGDIITTEHFLKLILHKKGLFKGTPPGAKKVVLLNQADLMEQRRKAVLLARQILDNQCGIEGVVISCFDPLNHCLLWGERK